MKRGPKKKKLKEMKTKRSQIWLYFTLKDEDQIAECNECHSRYSTCALLPVLGFDILVRIRSQIRIQFRIRLLSSVTLRMQKS